MAISCCLGVWQWLAALASRGATRAKAIFQPSLQTLVVVIAGPTAVGKSDTAVEVAKLLQLQGRKVRLISADSVQVYKGLDIGSNKPSAEEQEKWPLQLIDWMEPGNPCTAGTWTKEAMRQVDEALSQEETPIIVGGSCMYLDWLVNGEPDAPKSDPAVQAQIAAQLQPFQDSMDWDGAIALLAAVDADKAAKINRNNWQRLSRQLEVVRSPQQQSGRSSRDGYDIRAFFLSPADRQALFHRIDRRCVKMLQKGLLEEVATLLEQGSLKIDTPAADAIGYRQVLDYLTRPEVHERDGDSFMAFIRRFGAASRNYAKSQMQWFMKDQSFMWLAADPANPEVVGAKLHELCRLRQWRFRTKANQDRAEREMQAAQAAAIGFTFSSDLEDGLTAEEEAELLRRADECTERVPPADRQQLPLLKTFPLESGVNVGKVFWFGRHPKWGWGNPLGKLHRQGLQLFSASGWQVLKGKDDERVLPAFCWPTRHASHFPSHASNDLPLIRPFPQEFTRVLDDKATLARRLNEAGCSDHPDTWTAREFLENPPPGEGSEGSDIFFLNHSVGVKGNGVHVLDKVALLHRLGEMGQGCEPFIVQRCVTPVALRNGRKWVIRAHVLLHGRMDGQIQLYLHKHAVCLEYGHVYTERLNVKSAHVSNSAKMKYLPKPELIEDHSILQQLRLVVGRVFSAVVEDVPRGPFTPKEAELCQIFGLDFIMDGRGKAWLLEVNDYPAIASGTMEHVDTQVYTKLVRDLLHLVVLPKVDGTDGVLGGWQMIEWAGDKDATCAKLTWCRCFMQS